MKNGQISLSLTALCGLLVLAGCGSSSSATQSPSHTAVTNTSASATPSSQQPTPSSASVLTSITYSKAQQTAIINSLNDTGFTSLLPTHGYSTTFVSAAVTKPPQAPSDPVLQVDYSNFLVQESGSRKAVIAPSVIASSPLSITIPHSGDSHKVPGSWLTLAKTAPYHYRHALSLDIKGVYYLLDTRSLTKAEMILVAKSLSAT